MVTTCPDINVTLDPSAVIPIWWITKGGTPILIQPGETKTAGNPHKACIDPSECTTPSGMMCSTHAYVFDGRENVTGVESGVDAIGWAYAHDCIQTLDLKGLYKGAMVCDFCNARAVHVTVTEAPELGEAVPDISPYFVDSQPGTILHEEDRGIHVALPAVVNLATGVDYQFHIFRDGHPEDPEEGILLFNLRVSNTGLMTSSDVEVYNEEKMVKINSGTLAAASLAAALHIHTRPEGATVKVGTTEVGTTNTVYEHTVPDDGKYKEKVSVTLSLKHFKDKKFKKTLYAGLQEDALYRLSTATKIKGVTKKSNAAGAASFTFTLYKKTGSKAQIVEAGMNLRLLNQANGQVRQLTTDALGVATITIPYEDEFFEAGKQKLVCSLEGTADKIRTFKSIKVSKVTGDAVGTDEEWHDDNENESDDITSTSDGRSVAIDAAYARIGQ